MKLKDYLDIEVYRNNTNPIKKFYLKHFNPETNAVYLIRKIQFTKTEIFRLLLSRKLLLRYGIAFGYDFFTSGYQIGVGLRIEHANGIVITKCSIGANVTIYHQVTIGKKEKVVEDAKIIIGSGSTLYAGCKVVGNVNIGENTVVGAGAVVIHDTFPNSVYVGVPAEKLKGGIG